MAIYLILGFDAHFIPCLKSSFPLIGCLSQTEGLNSRCVRLQCKICLRWPYKDISIFESQRQGGRNLSGSEHIKWSESWPFDLIIWNFVIFHMSIHHWNRIYNTRETMTGPLWVRTNMDAAVVVQVLVFVCLCVFLTCCQVMPSLWYSSCSCLRISSIKSCCSFSLQ